MLEKLYNLYKEDNVKITVEYAKDIVAYIIVSSQEKANQMLYTLRDLCNTYKSKTEIFNILIVRYMKALFNRLGIANKNKENDKNIDWIFNEIQTLHDYYVNIIPEFAGYFIYSLYYLFCFKWINNRTDECQSILDTVVELRNTANSNTAPMIDECLNNIMNLMES